MNRDTLKQIMIDQKESYLNNPLIPRKYFLEENVNYCFVGIRRTGKSYMMYQKIQSLIEKGVPGFISPSRMFMIRILFSAFTRYPQASHIRRICLLTP